MSDLRKNPRVNALLVALRRIRDHSESLESAKKTALSAIEHYINAAQSNEPRDCIVDGHTWKQWATHLHCDQCNESIEIDCP